MPENCWTLLDYLECISDDVHKIARKHFTDDEEFLDMFESIGIPFANMLIWLNLASVFSLIFGAMGRNDIVFYLGLIGSWVGQVPGVMVAVYFKRDISSVYQGVSFGYFLLCLLY